MKAAVTQKVLFFINSQALASVFTLIIVHM